MTYLEDGRCSLSNNLNLYEYLKFLLEHHPNKRMSDNELANLAPWSETVQELCRNKME